MNDILWEGYISGDTRKFRIIDLSNNEAYAEMYNHNAIWCVAPAILESKVFMTAFLQINNKEKQSSNCNDS